MKPSFMFDKDEHGILRRYNGGTYRFTVRFHADSTEAEFTSYGWRIGPDGQSVLPPVSITKTGGVFTQGAMSLTMQKDVLDQFRIERDTSDNIAESKRDFDRMKHKGR